MYIENSTNSNISFCCQYNYFDLPKMEGKPFDLGGNQLNIVQSKIDFSLILTEKVKEKIIHTGVAMNFSLFPFIIHYWICLSIKIISTYKCPFVFLCCEFRAPIVQISWRAIYLIIFILILKCIHRDQSWLLRRWDFFVTLVSRLFHFLLS